MSRLLDVDLEKLTTNLFRMGELAEETIALSINAFLNGGDTSEKVRALSDILITMSLDIEDKVFELIAKYQPVASDLRIIKSYLKIGYDLERYGRYAWDISFIHKRLMNAEQCGEFTALFEQLTQAVMDMVHLSIQALKNHDAELAKTLATTEDKVDGLYFQFLDLVAEATSITQCAITSLLVVRYLERIADHATYMGESIIYIVTGEKLLLR